MVNIKLVIKMKKIIVILILIISVYMLLGNIVAKSEIIPDEAIRIRIIPNSNSKDDQRIKYLVKSSLEKELYKLLENIKSINDARTIINNNISKLDKNINELLKNEEYNKSYNINYGLNYFPKKEFKGVNYKEGYYESLVVTLGDGLGDNWWCVLFPPLCTLEVEETNMDDVEYTTLAKSIIDKYF